jgi:hypothetical protein
MVKKNVRIRERNLSLMEVAQALGRSLRGVHESYIREGPTGVVTAVGLAFGAGNMSKAFSAAA